MADRAKPSVLRAARADLRSGAAVSSVVDAPIEHRDAAKYLDVAELVLIDLDGCLAFGNQPHPAASALLDRLAGRYAILSNNSTETPEGLAGILACNGLSVDPRRVLLAGSSMVEMLAVEQAGRRILLLASEAIHAFARESRLRLVDEDAEIVALARDTTLTHEKLTRALNSIQHGARLIVSNPDLTHPGPNRMPVMETGAVLQLFRACVPTLDFTVIGKPSRTMFEIALARFGGTVMNTIMIGDNPETDGIGASNIGIRPILVGPNQLYSSIAELL